MNKRITSNLLDTLLYDSAFYQESINPKANFFFSKRKFISLLFNLIIPLTIFLFILFVLKIKYNNKYKQSTF